MQYHPKKQRLRLVTGIAVLSLILAACHGASSGSAPYLPSSGMSSRQSLDRGIVPNGEEQGELFSSCGDHIRIVLAGIVNCRFHEVGGSQKDVFTLKNDTQGLILISPLSGNRNTTFTITALVFGSGHFTVKDGKGDRLVVTVRVSLL
ncbi:MAG TPA: hypothetical protein VMT95_03050 [Candidatus Binatia bacterium]|nr:hypothetical protein [Candidatus Binatia bacterium]